VSAVYGHTSQQRIIQIDRQQNCLPTSVRHSKRKAANTNRLLHALFLGKFSISRVGAEWRFLKTGHTANFYFLTNDIATYEQDSFKKRKSDGFPRQGLTRTFDNFLGKYDLKYYFDQARLAEPKIFETVEIFSATAAECEAIAHKTFARWQWRFINEKERREFAWRIEEGLLKKFRDLRGYVSVVYKRCGGIFDTGGRYIPIFKGATSRGRSLDYVLKQTLYNDGIEVARKSATTLNEIVLDHAQIKKQRAIPPQPTLHEALFNERILTQLRIVRYSNWQGLKNARKSNPQIWNGRVIARKGMPTLFVVHSARKGDITHNKSVRKALKEMNPDVVVFADVDRLGREYWESAYQSFENLGFRVEFNDPDWAPDMHLRPATTKIDQQTAALTDEVCLLHKSAIDTKKINRTC
jgi:hypothetical protein